MNMLIDRFGREHSYLRISVTDRCNLRCVYCMPAEGINVKPKAEILTFEEIYRIAKVFAVMGVAKVRVTGGEPLVRKDLPVLIALLRSIPQIRTVAMTTNGVLLQGKCQTLRQAGLDAINISLDTLRAQRFKELTLRDNFEDVVAAIDEAIATEFSSLKVNVVVMRNRNEDEIMDFIERYKDERLNVRFIEYMPFKDNQWQPGNVYSFAIMKETIERSYQLEALPSRAGDVAKDFRIKNHAGTVSFITSMTDSFCGTCNRLRIMADGSVKSCLFSNPEINLRDPLRAGATDEDLSDMINWAVQQKPEAHPPMEELAEVDNRAMVEIGG
jgi:cyclic pyranopterin phosphate synthase